MVLCQIQITYKYATILHYISKFTDETHILTQKLGQICSKITMDTHLQVLNQTIRNGLK